MPIRLKDKGRKYKRFQHTQDEKNVLLNSGLTPVVSSNVSAIAKQGNSLIVRFHGGATYEYPKNGKDYANMLNSTSKGKYVWTHFIRKNVPYRRIANVPLTGDERFTDTDIMYENELQQQARQEMLQRVKGVPKEAIPTVPIESVEGMIPIEEIATQLKTLVTVDELLAVGIIANYLREDKVTNA